MFCSWSLRLRVTCSLHALTTVQPIIIPNVTEFFGELMFLQRERKQSQQQAHKSFSATVSVGVNAFDALRTMCARVTYGDNGILCKMTNRANATNTCSTIQWAQTPIDDSIFITHCRDEHKSNYCRRCRRPRRSTNVRIFDGRRTFRSLP